MDNSMEQYLIRHSKKRDSELKYDFMPAMLEIIEKKKLGKELTKEEITFFANGAAEKTVPDYQLSALLMAIRLNGMNAKETASLTIAMRDSGDVLPLQFDGMTLEAWEGRDGLV